MIEPMDCPVCGTQMKFAVYGLPSKELAEGRSVKLMGCLIDADPPEWFCEPCDSYFLDGAECLQV